MQLVLEPVRNIPSGTDEFKLGDYAWFGGMTGNADQKTHSVGQKAPNPFGVYDMYGNVSEWVEDCYVDTYSGAPTDGSPVVSSTCERRSSSVGVVGTICLRHFARQLAARTRQRHGSMTEGFGWPRLSSRMTVFGPMLMGASARVFEDKQHLPMRRWMTIATPSDHRCFSHAEAAGTVADAPPSPVGLGMIGQDGQRGRANRLGSPIVSEWVSVR